MNTQPHNHIVKSHDEERRILLDEILRMGEMAAAQLEAALDVIDRRDGKAAERIVANDEAIDALELQVSHDAMKLALRGPLARDLREILAALRIASDIELIPIQQIIDAWDRLLKQDVRYRFVIDMASLKS